MAMNAETQQPGHWNRFGRAITVLLRLIFVVVIAVLVGAGVYYGAPWV